MGKDRKPFLGSDLEDLRLRLGFTVDDMVFLTGLTKQRWFYYTKKLASLQIPDPTVAIYCRLIADDSKLVFIPEFSPPQYVFSKINENMSGGVTQKEFSILMGNNESSSSRWLSGRSNPSQTVKRLSHVLAMMIVHYGFEEALDKIRSVVAYEATVRGVPDVWSDGRWNDAGKDDDLDDEVD